MKNSFDFHQSATVDQVGILERVYRFSKRSIKEEAKVEGLKLALSMIDLTTLEGIDTPNKVKQICYKAAHLHDTLPGLPDVAAVCVYPSFVKVAKKALAGTGIKVASVATSFPSGQSDSKIKIQETTQAVKEGADEIDMIISRGQFLSGNYSYVYDEIISVKKACGAARLKVILETGELGNLDKVRRASDIAMHAGADFIKTSTGKINPAATFDATLVMLEAIRHFYYQTGKMVGMKPAGGIATAKLALQNLVMVKETLGNSWMSSEWFRFGASRLANDILMQLMKQKTGHYQSFNYFSID